MNRIAWWLLLVLCLVSCSSDDGMETALPQPVLYVVFSPDGLGDNGYNDEILWGVARLRSEQGQGLAVSLCVPDDMEDAGRQIRRIIGQMEDADAGRSLLVLATPDYVSLAQQLFAGREHDADRDVLVFETDALQHAAVHSLLIDMYGASWLAGHTARTMGCERPVCVLANADARVLQGARDGFADGFGEDVPTEYLARDTQGFAMADTLYRRMARYDQHYDFVFPVAGGSNMGGYRYLREHDGGGLWTAGMDVDQSPYSNHIVGSVVKHIDELVYDFVTAWLRHAEQPLYQHFGLGSEYVNWQIATGYSHLLSAVEAVRDEAIRKEAAYEQQ